ncbi:hypothetical protein V0M98_35215 (plasmid) [Pseudomonas silesiensis]|uniref:hypothetical protein n=1 Tax=Pseudomonas silesiensis TaxID=1853130 RepID=UPI0030D5AF49
MSQINLNLTNYGQEAYNMAYEWYMGNGPVPIPRLTEEECAAQGLPDYSVLFQPLTDNNTANQTIGFGKGKTIMHLSIELAPVIAAIKLGFSDRKILEMMLHHNIKSAHFSEMSATTLEPIFQSVGGKDFYLHDVYISIVKALSLNPAGRGILDEASRSADYNADLHVGLLHADDQKYWNATRIKDLADSISGNDYNATPHYTGFNELSDSLASISCFPENSALEYLRRSGMLNEDVISKRSANYGMWETTLARLVIDKPTALKLFLACANSTIPNEKVIIRRALKSITMDSYDATNLSPSYCLERLQDIFVDSTLEDVFHSDVLRLNLMAVDRPQDFDGSSGGAAGYERICAQNSELINRLTKEVMAVPENELGYSHFSCWRRLPQIDLMPQRLQKGDPEALVIHMLDGFDRFTYPDNETEEKTEIDKLARAGLKDLVQVLACHHDFDYSYFQDLSSTHKKDLIKMGLDVKKLPGLTLQDLGEAFSHDMGL